MMPVLDGFRAAQGTAKRPAVAGAAGDPAIGAGGRGSNGGGDCGGGRRLPHQAVQRERIAGEGEDIAAVAAGAAGGAGGDRAVGGTLPVACRAGGGRNPGGGRRHSIQRCEPGGAGDVRLHAGGTAESAHPGPAGAGRAAQAGRALPTACRRGFRPGRLALQAKGRRRIHRRTGRPAAAGTDACRAWCGT